MAAESYPRHRLIVTLQDGTYKSYDVDRFVDETLEITVDDIEPALKALRIEPDAAKSIVLQTTVRLEADA